jgi:GR25 family glycosyltransferase involved in LPS biosynthesis
MSGINSFFESIFCVNLDRRIDKWEESLLEFEKWGIENVQRFSAYDGKKLNSKETSIKTSELGLVLSNIDIVEKCLQENSNNLLILEDDCYFTPEIQSFVELSQQIPDDWDLLYFGGNHNSHKGVDPPIQVSKNLVQVHHTFSTHAVGINKKFFRTLLDRISKKNAPLDVMLTDLQKGCKAYCFSPSIAFQRVGFSDIQMQNMDYHRWIK